MNKLASLVKKYKMESTLVSGRNDQEELWKKYMVEETPMGCLFLNNDFKSQIDKHKDIVLLHISSNIEQIKKDKMLFSSGGGLGGVVYCTPVHSDGSPHNLADFIIKQELPGFINSRKAPLLSTVGLVAITIPSHLFLSNTCSFVETNYIEFGKKYLNSYDRLLKKGKISILKDERVLNSLEEEFNNLLPFLELFCPNMYEVPMENFIKLLEKNIPKSEMILNCYFEVIIEYFYLHQNDRTAISLKRRGELNNSSVKEMIFDLVPELYEGFSTRKFKIKPSDFVQYFEKNNEKNNFIKNFDANHFYLYLRWRLSYYIFITMLNGVAIENNHRYLSNEITKTYPNLSGQLKYKIMQDDSYLVEAEFSKKFLCSGSDIKIVSYKNIPKGELGLRIKKVNNEVKFFEAYINENNKVILGNEIDISISSKLIKPRSGIMRDPTHKKNQSPLYVLAANKSLGSLQMMDRATLAWIEQKSKDIIYQLPTRPLFLFREDVEVLKKYFPEEAWFLSRPHQESIHGKRHIGRVSLLVLLLCNYIFVSENIKYTAFLASVVHDLRRFNDNQDIGHGDRSSKWLKNNLKIFENIIKKFNINTRNAILAAKYHNYELSKIPYNLPDDCMKVISILKTADALDRFRQPKESWWTNPDMLMEPSAAQLMFLARQITLYVEGQYLKGIDSKVALINSIDFLKISIK